MACGASLVCVWRCPGRLTPALARHAARSGYGRGGYDRGGYDRGGYDRGGYGG